MKKYMIVAILIGIALGGIWGASLPGESEKRENPAFTKVSVRGKEIVDSSTFMEVQGSLAHDTATDNQIEKCQDAIYGRITKTEYLIHHDTPWTKLEIACQENFKGGIEKGQQISVYVLGGYLDKDSYEKKFDDVAPIDDDGLVEMKYFQNELSKVGDEGVFYLVSDHEEDIFEKDAYFLLCSGYSKMMYDKKTGDIKETAHESVKKVPRGQFFSKIRAHVKQKK